MSERLHDQDKDDRTKRDQKTSRQARRSEKESASRRTTKTSKERKPTNTTEPSIHHTQHHIGLPATVPKEWLQTLKVDIPREAGHPLLIDVTKQLLVRKYDGGDELEYGDFIRKVNGRKVNTRAELVAILEEFKCPSAPHTAVITVVRPRRKMEIPEHGLLMYLPNANETVPGFTYFHVGLVLPPGARLGVSVRSFKNKVSDCSKPPVPMK
ncbi:hypothetical protein AAVH_07592 [Aphelenchoides avenae]|nr:hypothetical protein AAVH_07592 [Aphelenchus avenae]